ncbi:hypothetical protein [Thermococcus thermotolerans]|uniref:hypothetical protein n=1 Tax=Thermococcus thermotolerans TaxID=2969672 RepID=UPI002157CFA3|nr:hypothetical protein [Thermococcus thermotolerans]
MFAVLLGLLMIGVTAESASATANINKQPTDTPLILTVQSLSPIEKKNVLLLAQRDLRKLGVSSVSVDALSGVKSEGKYVFFINTSKGIVVGTYDGSSLSMALVTYYTSNKITVKVVTNGQVHYEYYDATVINTLKQTISKSSVLNYKTIGYDIGTTVRAPKESETILPQWHYEQHWWGWKLTLNEHETQMLLDFMGIGIAGGGTKIGRAALIAFLERIGITVAESILMGIAEALILAGAYIKVVDDLGGNKGIYIKQVLGGPIIIWHN